MYGGAHRWHPPIRWHWARVRLGAQTFWVVLVVALVLNIATCRRKMISQWLKLNVARTALSSCAMPGHLDVQPCPFARPEQEPMRLELYGAAEVVVGPMQNLQAPHARSRVRWSGCSDPCH